MPDDILKSYPHAMVIDDETGKPMQKVQAVGGPGGGGGEVVFPNDYPDEGSNLKLTDIYDKLVDIETEIKTHGVQLVALNEKIESIVDGSVTINVTVISEEPEEVVE